MKLTIELDLNNAAFVDHGIEEVSRLLQDICDRLPDPLTETQGRYQVHDRNAEHAGTFSVQ